MLEKTLSASAFIVNESRARAEDLSLDSYAKLWVDEDVRKLWRKFREEVYGTDPQALAVRNRFFLRAVNEFFKQNPTGIFVNIAAGFTSYPYLMQNQVETIEIDLPAVMAYKTKKVIEFTNLGCLPKRDITFLAGDLNTTQGIDAIEHNLREKIKDRPSFLLLEGISYYLKPSAFSQFMAAASRLQAHGSELSLDYWEPGNMKNDIFLKFSDFLERRCNHPSRNYNLMTPVNIRSFPGYKVKLETDVSAFERQIADAPVLQDWATRIPENFVILVRAWK